MLYILDSVLRNITEHIAIHPPERGGALLGSADKPLVTRFILDDCAKTTYASYSPSRELSAVVQMIEREEGLEYKGIIHSHPSNIDHPSGPDEQAVKSNLEVNPHMRVCLVPIVTNVSRLAGLDRHELALRTGKISFFAGYRRRGGHIEVKPVNNIAVVPLQEDLERIRAEFDKTASCDVFLTREIGIEMLAGSIVFSSGLELLFLVSELYPALPPILLVTQEGGKTEQVQLPWSLETPAEERLIKAVRTFLSRPGPYRKVYGPSGGPVLTNEEEVARLAGWKTWFSGRDCKRSVRELLKGIFARSSGLLSKSISDKRVLIAGVGSVGSYLAEQLIRSGVGAITLIDHDTVEPANLSRTVYDLTDVGRPKVEALARKLLNINPSVKLDLQPVNVRELDKAILDAKVRAADLVIAVTDDREAQRLLNHFAYARKKTALFVGIYAGAKGGEVIISVPDKTPCYLCATYFRDRVEKEAEQSVSSKKFDYGTMRLQGEIALGVDIQHISSAAAKMALSLLLPANARASLKGFLDAQINAGAVYATFSTVPDYWFYPAFFEGTPGQFAYQSVWLAPERSPDCAVCGGVGYRTDPLKIVPRAPRNLRR